MYERILVPLDGSDVAEAALPLAELIPSRGVRLLQVEPTRVTAARDRLGAAGGQWGASRLERATTSHRYLERTGEGLRRQGREVEILVESGDPAARIVAAAADADLLIMATRGRGAGGRAVFGSVADHVARHAPSPTLLVPGCDPSAPAPLATRLVVPLDGSALADAALPVAADLGEVLGLTLHLVRVVDPSLSLSSGGAAEREAAAYLEARAKRISERDLIATSEVRSGVVVRGLLEAIAPTDLVVMTTRGRGGLRRLLLGSVAEQLVRGAVGPVLLVRAGTAEVTETTAEVNQPATVG